jgi:CHAT domain-containing protein
MGLQPQALEELAVATDTARERLGWGDLAALWREVGGIHLEQGRIEQALEAFGKRLKSAVALEDGAQHASALVDTGYAFVLLGHGGQAHEAVREAKVLGGDGLMADPVTVERLARIADLLSRQLGAAGEAAELMGRAAELYRRAGDGTGAARAEVYAAHLAARGGDTKALTSVDADAQGLPDPEPLALLRRFQAEAALLAHSYDRCEKRAAEAKDLADRRGLIPVAVMARVFAARCGAEVGHLEPAIRHADEAGAMVEQQLRHASGELVRQKLGFQAYRIYRLLLSLQARSAGPRRVEDGFITSERARGRAHLDAVVRRQVAAFSDTLPVSPALEADRAAAEERVRRLTKALLEDRKRRGLVEQREKALWALEEIKQAIHRSNPLLARIAPPAPADLAQARQALVDGETLLLSYFVAGDQVLLFAIDAESATLDVLADDATSVSQAVERFRSAHLLRPTTELGPIKQAASSLFRSLLGKVASRLEGKRRLVIMPHGRLWALPFESLVDQQDRFLVQTHDVHYVLSATLAVALTQSEARDGPADGRRAFVGMGDPVYDWASFSQGRPEGRAPANTRGLELWTEAAGGAAASASGTLQRLPGTAKELRSIAGLFPGQSDLYLRARASEELVKKGALGGHRIVHVATHGLIAPHYEALALTLAPDSQEDGFLMGSEIAELDLDADLVVLSACQTGREKGHRETVWGLPLSLRAAGARRVVLSLWSVDDDATADLMSRFYRPLTQATPSYHRSLSEAKRAMVDQAKWSHPFYWAAFVLLGN